MCSGFRLRRFRENEPERVLQEGRAVFTRVPKKNLDSRFRARIAAETERITDIMRMRASELQCWLNRGRRSRSHGTR